MTITIAVDEGLGGSFAMLFLGLGQTEVPMNPECSIHAIEPEQRRLVRTKRAVVLTDEANLDVDERRRFENEALDCHGIGAGSLEIGRVQALREIRVGVEELVFGPKRVT